MLRIVAEKIDFHLGSPIVHYQILWSAQEGSSVNEVTWIPHFYITDIKRIEEWNWWKQNVLVLQPLERMKPTAVKVAANKIQMSIKSVVSKSFSTIVRSSE